MTSSQQSVHMYAGSAIRFRDPFAVSKGLTPPSLPKTTSHGHERTNPSWPSHVRINNYSTALTPPPEMAGVQQPTATASYHLSEHVHEPGEHMSTQQVHRLPMASYIPQDASHPIHAPSNTALQNASRSSPARQPHAEPSADHPSQRRASQSNAIASNFQIPRSVNESGGSLAELAAQTLQQVEDSPVPLQPWKNLVPDAKPTTGFRKLVTTILSTTMVAQNVVVLALLFIYRLKKLNPTVKGKPGSEYRLLTVALMLGNKFLDDNTYTNKTWAEVSGINVAEVHIMEVEFLSNMKYCLFTSEQDWAQWQSLLGRFAAFFERASRPLPPAPILPPASSLHLPMALPSPPASNQASPPYPTEGFSAANYSSAYQHGPTPAPSPLGNQFGSRPVLSQPGSRKRSRDEQATEPPPKRVASGYQSYTSPQRYSTMAPQPAVGRGIPRLTLPSLSIPTSQGQTQLANQSQQLPPLNVPARAMAMVYPTSSSQTAVTQPQVTAGPSSQTYSQSQLQHGLRHQSPFGGSAVTSPSSAAPLSATALHPPHQISPTYFLQQRSSPYRPVHHVSTLLYPPSSTTAQTRPPTVELNQMQYQPLGRSVQHSGRLPYVSQNMWLDGNQPQEMTPIHMWPGMSAYTNLQHQGQQQSLAHQQ